ARKFCRRCGSSLIDAPVAKRPGFFKRLFTRKPKEPVAAGTRPMRRGGSAVGDARRAGRQARGRIFGLFASARQLLAVLALFGIGVGIVIPNIRNTVTGWVTDGVNKIRNTISPSYTTVFPTQDT